MMKNLNLLSLIYEPFTQRHWNTITYYKVVFYNIVVAQSTTYKFQDCPTLKYATSQSSTSTMRRLSVNLTIHCKEINLEFSLLVRAYQIYSYLFYM